MPNVSAGGATDILIAEGARMTADRDAFVEAMSRAVSGVSIVTTDGQAGRFGQTVSAMSSVSADPPLLLVCINRKSPTCTAGSLSLACWAVGVWPVRSSAGSNINIVISLSCRAIRPVDAGARRRIA